MAVMLRENFRAAFPLEGEGAKSDTVANVLIDRVLRGDYSDTREIGPSDADGLDKLIIGSLYLMIADENTYVMRPDVEAFVLRIEHEARLLNYYEFGDIDGARAFMTAKG